MKRFKMMIVALVAATFALMAGLASAEYLPKKLTTTGCTVMRDKAAYEGVDGLTAGQKKYLSSCIKEKLVSSWIIQRSAKDIQQLAIEVNQGR